MSISGASGRTGWGRRRAPSGGSTQGQALPCSIAVLVCAGHVNGRWHHPAGRRSELARRGAYQPADRRHTAAHTPLLRAAVLLVRSLGNCLVEDVCGRYPPWQSKHRLSKLAHFTAFTVGTVAFLTHAVADAFGKIHLANSGRSAEA